MIEMTTGQILSALIATVILAIAFKIFKDGWYGAGMDKAGITR